jgi:hypothetical protein
MGMAMDEENRSCYRRYSLVVRELSGGWGAWIEDPAGHVADVVLHEHLAARPWATAQDARRAAERFVDDLVGDESSY